MSDYYEPEYEYEDDYVDDGGYVEEGYDPHTDGDPNNALVAQALIQAGEEMGVRGIEQLTDARDVAERLYANRDFSPHLPEGPERAQEAIRKAVASYARPADEFDVVRKHLTRNLGRPR
jgi:hypothetical protein